MITTGAHVNYYRAYWRTFVYGAAPSDVWSQYVTAPADVLRVHANLECDDFGNQTCCKEQSNKLPQSGTATGTISQTCWDNLLRLRYGLNCINDEPAICTNGGNASSREACENTGASFTSGICHDTNNNTLGNFTTRIGCLFTGNLYVPAEPNVSAALCTNGGDASSQQSCELTGNVYTPSSCSDGRSDITEVDCIFTGNFYVEPIAETTQICGHYCSQVYDACTSDVLPNSNDVVSIQYANPSSFCTSFHLSLIHI